MGDMAGSTIGLDLGAMDELSSPAARTLLDTIDGLRELQIGEIVNLPQIIVVGDQSSGKSSVLEAISSVRFPTKGDICTRFATEVVLRRAQETRIDVRIYPFGSNPSEVFHRTIFNKDSLPEIISEATEKMGIHPGSTKGFTQDILRVEVASSDVYPLTLVDLPGFFHSETEDQTYEDKVIVEQLAERYMKQPKSIILAVVAANNNLANQIVVDEAKKYDPKRERTLGVITKPDLTAPESQDEKKCLQLIRGQENKHRLKLGWHVLRNRPEGKEGTNTADRDAEEDKFFRMGAWSKITPASRGIAALRKKLSRVLLKHIQKTLPGVVEEIESNLSTRQHALEHLGKPRLDPLDLRTYLLEIAESFQRLARDGTEGRYGDEFFGGLYDDREARKLRALLRKLNRAFHVTLVTKGIDRRIEWEGDDMIPFHYGEFGRMVDEDSLPDYLRPYLDLFGRFPEPTTISEADLCEELEQLAAANQGIEFPSLPNGNLGFQLFKMQVRPWGGIAAFYLDQVVNFAKSFVEELFTHVVGPDKQTANAVLVSCVDGFFEDKRIILNDKLCEILRPYASAYGPPLDAEFNATLSSMTMKREAGRAASLLEEKFPAAFTEKGGKGLIREQVEQAFSNVQNRASEFSVDKVIDMTMTHFEVRTCFVFYLLFTRFSTNFCLCRYPLEHLLRTW